MSLTFTVLILINIFFIWLFVERSKNIITLQIIETKNALDIANGANYNNINCMADRMQSISFLF